MNWVTVNPDFEVMLLFDVECLENCAVFSRSCSVADPGGQSGHAPLGHGRIGHCQIVS